MIKLVFAAVIVVGSLLTLVAKRFWGRQALERKLAKLEEKLKEAQDERQDAIDPPFDADTWYIADSKCWRLLEQIRRLRERLGKNP